MWDCVVCQQFTALCINCCSIWKQVMRFTANHKTVFNDKMRITITCNISCSPRQMHALIQIFASEPSGWMTAGGSDVDRGIGGWAIVLSGLKFGRAASLECCRRCWIGPGCDGRAFLDSREPRAGGVHGSLKPSRLGDWFFGMEHDSQLRSVTSALAHQLPRVSSSATSLVAVPAILALKARVGLHGQQCDCFVHQLAGLSIITLHVTTRPPSPPLKSDAARVSTRRPISVWPTCSHDSLLSLDNGDFIPKWSSWSSWVDLGKLCLLLTSHPTAFYTIPWPRPWCCSHWEDPWICTIGAMLSFLQKRLECRLSPSTLK